MKNNTLYELNDILFGQLKNMTDKSLTGEKLDEAIRVSTAVQGLSQTIIANAALVLKAGLTVNNSLAEVQMPKMLETPPQKVLEAPQAGPSRKQAAIDHQPKALNG